MSTFALLIPLSLASLQMTGPILVHGGILRFFAAILFLAALALATFATLEFKRCGGTPEPNEPPLKLCETGIYRHLRHPIQLAEISFVISGALLLNDKLCLCYAAVFSLLVVGPLRIFEEQKMLRRFGESYRLYRRRTPAFLFKMARHSVASQ